MLIRVDAPLPPLRAQPIHIQRAGAVRRGRLKPDATGRRHAASAQGQRAPRLVAWRRGLVQLRGHDGRQGSRHGVRYSQRLSVTQNAVRSNGCHGGSLGQPCRRHCSAGMALRSVPPAMILSSWPNCTGSTGGAADHRGAGDALTRAPSRTPHLSPATASAASMAMADPMVECVCKPTIGSDPSLRLAWRHPRGAVACASGEGFGERDAARPHDDRQIDITAGKIPFWIRSVSSQCPLPQLP